MKIDRILLAILFLVMSVASAHAGGAVARQKQMEQMKQQQILAQKRAIAEAQKKAYEEAMRKKMMQYLAAKKAAEQKKAYEEALYKKVYEKKMAEKIAYERAVKAAMQKRAAQAVVQKKVQQNALYQKRVQEEAARIHQLAMLKKERKQELMQEYREKTRQQQFEQYKQRQSRVLKSGQGHPQGKGDTPPGADTEDEDIVEISQIWDRLEDNSEVWTLMIDKEPKVLTVQREIDAFKESGAILKKSASYYAERIDQILSQNPEMKQYPLRNILRILAVMDYDFNNGQNKDLMAMEVLGAELYLQNKKRPGLLDDVY